MQCPILQLDKVDSTNRYVVAHFDELSDGVFVLAREQTAGRGRRERSWLARPGVNITGTLCMKHGGAPFLAGCVMGLAALETLRSAAPELDFFIKWPNDVYVGDAKIAGILCESCGIAAGRIRGVAAGLGLNVNMDADDISCVSNNRAASLATACGRRFNLEKVAASLAQSLFKYYSIYKRDPEILAGEWRAENRLIGENIELMFDDGSRLGGVFAAIAADGALELMEPSGRLRRFSCADVRIDRGAIDFTKLKNKRISS